MPALHPVCSMEMICHVNGPNRRRCCCCRIDTSTRRPPTARQERHHNHVDVGEPFTMLRRGRNQGVVSSVTNRKQQQQQQQQKETAGQCEKKQTRPLFRSQHSHLLRPPPIPRWCYSWSHLDKSVFEQ